jgi:hypothetical protein
MGHGGTDELAFVVEGNDAGALEHEVRHPTHAGQRAGVRRSGLGAALGAPGAHGQYRLARRHRTGHLEKSRRVSQALGVEHDDARAFVLPVVPQDLGDRDVAAVAVGGIHAQAHADVGQPLQDETTDATALRHQRNPASGRQRVGEVAIGAQRWIGVDDALAVGPEHPDAVPPCLMHEGVLQAHAFVTELAEAGGVDDHRAHALGAALRHQAGHLRGWHHQVHQVHFTRHLGQTGIGRQAADLRRAGVHRVDRPAVAEGLKVGDERVADGVLACRGADDRHRTRPEQRLQSGVDGVWLEADSHARSISCSTKASTLIRVCSSETQRMSFKSPEITSEGTPVRASSRCGRP